MLCLKNSLFYSFILIDNMYFNLIGLNFFIFFLFWNKLLSVIQAGLELVIPLPQPSKSWYYGYKPLLLAWILCLWIVQPFLSVFQFLFMICMYNRQLCGVGSLLLPVLWILEIIAQIIGLRGKHFTYWAVSLTLIRVFWDKSLTNRQGLPWTLDPPSVLSRWWGYRHVPSILACYPFLNCFCWLLLFILKAIEKSVKIPSILVPSVTMMPGKFLGELESTMIRKLIS